MNQQIAGLSMRERVLLAESRMREMPQVDLHVEHHFSPGVYARELHIPAGTILTGQIHKFANLNILSKGTMYVLVGETVQYVEAPFTVVSPPGTKRIAYAQTDCVWTTIHGTDETDLDKIEDHFIAHSEQEFLAFCEKKIEQH